LYYNYFKVATKRKLYKYRRLKGLQGVYV